jgi:hypothetical protein
VADLHADRLDLRSLVEAYAFGCDRRDVELLRSCFVDGATIVVHWPNREPATMTAPHDLEQIPTGLARFDQTLHVVANHRAQLDGDAGTGEAYCFAHHLTGKDDYVMAIRYEDRYDRTADGWRIATRDVRILWTANQAVN